MTGVQTCALPISKINTGFDAVQAEMDQKADRAFAQVNDLAADTKDDTITFEGGTGITITTNPNEKKVIVTATGTATPGPHGSAHLEFGADPIPYATDTEGGLMSAEDKKKLTELERKLSTLIVNVVEFGADPEGILDSTAAFQTALNLVRDRGGGTVVVPAGEYKMTDTLRIYRNTHLILDPAATIVRHHNHSHLVNGDPGENYPEYSGHGNIIIEGGTWYGNVASFPDPFNGFGIGRGKNIVIRNVVFKDIFAYHAIDMNACEDVLIDNCKFLGHLDPDGTNGVKEAVQIAMHTQAGFSLFGPFDATPCRNVTIRNCYFGNSDTSGMSPWPVGVGNHYAVHDVFNSNIKVLNCTFEGCTYAAVRSFKFNDVVVDGCTFNDCNIAVLCSNTPAGSESSKDKDGNQTNLPQSGKRYKIVNNTIKGAVTGIGIYGQVYDTNIAKCADIVIANNFFHDDVGGGNAIDLHWVDGAKIIGNNFENVDRAIRFFYVSNTHVSKNNMKNLVFEGIYMEEPDVGYRSLGHTSTIDISHNTIRNTGRTGIFIQYVQHFVCSYNQIFDPAIEQHNTRDGILIGSDARYGVVAHNKVVKAASGNQNRYGIQVTSTCDEVRVFDNDVDGATGRSLVPTTNECFEGFFVSSPNGTRYKVTVTDAGAISVTAG